MKLKTDTIIEAYQYTTTASVHIIMENFGSMGFNNSDSGLFYLGKNFEFKAQKTDWICKDFSREELFKMTNLEFMFLKKNSTEL